MERLYYLSHHLYLLGIPILPRMVMLLIRVIYGSFIPYQARIGKNVHFGHKMGIVIAPCAQIGSRVKIRHHVTIGSGCARIGDDVVFGAGAKVIGSIKIGNGAIIGANAVVVEDIPPHAVAVGIPAQVVRILDENAIQKTKTTGKFSHG
jgi:serine O-acetyltransferase